MSEFNFKRYSSIENSYRKKDVEMVYATGNDGGDWVVEEKVHGTNFSVWCNADEVAFASRNRFLPLGGKSHHGHLNVVDDLHSKVRALYAQLKPRFPDEKYGDKLEEIVVYGELAGGSYPHDGVKPVPNQTRVQKGVYYSPVNFFYAFDVFVNGRLLKQTTARAFAVKAGFLFAEPLFVGTFLECLNHSCEFPTTLPEKFGLPAIEGNICEGIVIKPIEPRFFGNGSRILFKKKNDKWQEVGKKDKTPRVAKEQEDLSQTVIEALTEASAYVTENRFANVLSKMTDVTNPKMFGKILGEFTNDILEDFNKDHEFEMSPSERDRFIKNLKTRAVIIVKKHFELNGRRV